MSTVPYRDSSKSRQRRSLDRERIVTAASELLEEVGLDALTMRKLADKLGVRAPSLYRHVHDKNELLVLLADALSGDTTPASPSDLPWREALVQSAWQQRKAMLSQRDVARLMAITAPAGMQRLGHIEARLAVLRGAGFSERDAAWGAYHLNNLIMEFVADEIRLETMSRESGVSPATLMSNSREQLGELPKDEFPSLVAAAEHVATADQDALFQYGLDTWLDGLSSRLSISSSEAGKS